MTAISATRPAQAVGGGSLFFLTPGKGRLTRREPGGVLHTYIGEAEEAEKLFKICFGDEARPSLVRLFSGFQEAK